MPITAPAITSAIVAAGPGLTGPTWLQLATAIGIAVAKWATSPTDVVLAGVTIGAVGGGNVTGKLYLPPVPLPISASVAAAGLLGPLAPQVATAVGVGVGTALSASAGYTGVSVGAIGADVSKIVSANPATLIAGLTAAFAALNIKGPTASSLAIGLGSGIAAMFLTGTGVGVSVGGAGPSPGTGSSKSSLF